MHPANWLVHSLQEKGLLRTLKIVYNVVADFGFDWKHGTETTRWVKVDSFETPSDNKAHAVHYQASRARPLLQLLQRLQLPKNGAFVDLGCGKGRVLLLAADHGFKRVVGVDFCSQLCRQARKNAALFQRKHPGVSAIEVVESDAADHEFSGDETVFFLYNPFNAVVLARTLTNIAQSVRKNPRAIWLIYNTPLHHETIVQDGQFGCHEHFEIGGTEFRVYSDFVAAPVEAAEKVI